MGLFFHGQARDKETKKLLGRICTPHQIDIKSVHTVEINGVGEESRYRIEYINKDGHLCTIEVQGEIPEEIEPSPKRKIISSIRSHLMTVTNDRNGYNVYLVTDCNGETTKITPCSATKQKCKVKK